MRSKHVTTFLPDRRKLSGAALMIMLVVMIMGAVTFLVSSLNNVSTSIQGNEITAISLAQAKEALLGYAVKDDVRPGELPCPDVDNDGQLKLNVDYIGTNCVKLLGRLPWKTLGLADLRDAAGERLWYSISDTFHANGNTALHSDTAGTISVSGNISATNVIAIVFSPGKTLPGQNRSAVNSASAYLESIITEPTSYQQLTPNDLSRGAYTYNDQMILITPDQLFSAVELRLAREAKSCLDDYATSSAGKYPWAAPVSDTTGYDGAIGTYFGRLATIPNNNTAGTNDPKVDSLLTALTNLQDALNNYVISNNSNTRTELDKAGKILEKAVSNLKNAQPTSPVAPSSVTKPADKAGGLAKKLAGGDSSIGAVQSEIDSANNALLNTGISSSAHDPAMSTTWPSSCTLLSSSYWPAWRNLVFYQMAYGYQPGGSASCTGTNCIAINGADTFRAAVLLARRKIGTQNRSNTGIITTYLEGNNQHTSQSPSTSFESHHATAPTYSIVNDQVLCLDGMNTCR